MCIIWTTNSALSPKVGAWRARRPRQRRLGRYNAGYECNCAAADSLRPVLDAEAVAQPPDITSPPVSYTWRFYDNERSVRIDRLMVVYAAVTEVLLAVPTATRNISRVVGELIKLLGVRVHTKSTTTTANNKMYVVYVVEWG